MKYPFYKIQIKDRAVQTIFTRQFVEYGTAFDAHNTMENLCMTPNDYEIIRFDKVDTSQTLPDGTVIVVPEITLTKVDYKGNPIT